MSKGKRYTVQFKVKAATQVTEPGYSVQEVADGLGILPRLDTTGQAS